MYFWKKNFVLSKKIVLLNLFLEKRTNCEPVPPVFLQKNG